MAEPVILLLPMISPVPWLAGWNYALLKGLFHLVPHSGRRDSFAEFFTLNPLASTFLYAAVFYLLWRIEDENTVERRTHLAEIVVACSLAVFFTLLIRPWFGWPAPTRAAGFASLYPNYLSAIGSRNSFPSHSTLVYFLVAAGIWRLHPRLSLVLGAAVLLTISLPRVYLGGHYPVDVLGAVVIALCVFWIVRRWAARPAPARWFRRAIAARPLTELALFLWLFELAEGFRSLSHIFPILLRLAGFSAPHP